MGGGRDRYTTTITQDISTITTPPPSFFFIRSLFRFCDAGSPYAANRHGPDGMVRKKLAFLLLIRVTSLIVLNKRIQVNKVEGQCERDKKRLKVNDTI